MGRHLVTGAGSGIGAAVATLLHERNEELVLLARSEERAADLLSRFSGASVLIADLADPQALPSLTVPSRLDSLVHAAGVVEVAPVADSDGPALRDQIEVNLIAPMLLTRACLPALREASGTVVFVNSTSGLRANPGWAAYAASKAGLRSFADALRGEEAEHGVRVSSVHPGRTATPMQEKVHEQEGRDYEPRRWIRPESVARTVLHCLDAAGDASVTDVTVRPARG